jgi:Adenylate and Guanylate cyclase catalytic domain
LAWNDAVHLGSGQERVNVRGHGIAFQDAAGIFDGPTVAQTDDRYDYGEVRIYALGLVNGIEMIEFPMGVNVGDMFGDGVNIAARLEAVAKPGGICISAAAHEQVRDKLDFSFEDIGEQQVKNIARPVRSHRICGRFNRSVDHRLATMMFIGY